MWYKLQEQHILLYIVAKPNAKRSAIVKIDPEGLYIALHAKPQENAANEELCRFIGRTFKIPLQDVVLVRGKTSRYKTIKVPLTTLLRQFLEAPSKFCC